MTRFKAVLLGGVLALPAFAQTDGKPERPNEDSLFGEPAKTDLSDQKAKEDRPTQGGAADTAATHPIPPGNPSADELNLGGTPATDAFALGSVKEDALKIGGLFYVRAFGQSTQNEKLKDVRVNLPTLIDVYLDARPTERLRAEVLGRLQYDPFFSSSSFANLPSSGSNTTTKAPQNPSVALDQAFIAFDVARTVFVTAGRQHVKWGTARFFSPTDFLASQQRDPLAQFDARLGVTMVRASLPWEAKGWTFTAVALFEPTQVGTAGSSGSDTGASGTSSTTQGGSKFGDIGGAVRAEFEVGNTAFGVDALAQRNRKSRVGVDVSSQLGPIDVYGEAALKNGSDVPVYQVVVPADLSVGNPGVYRATQPKRGPLQVAGGANYSLALPNSRSLNFGLEYFFNSTGYTDAKIYPYLLFSGAFQPFYTGRHYGAASVALLDTTAKASYVLSNLGNLSDQSYLVRFDFRKTVLSYLAVEFFVDAHYGNRGGEFRLAFDSGPLALNGSSTGPIHIAAPLIDAGVGLRLSL